MTTGDKVGIVIALTALGGFLLKLHANTKKATQTALDAAKKPADDSGQGDDGSGGGSGGGGGGIPPASIPPAYTPPLTPGGSPVPQGVLGGGLVVINDVPGQLPGYVVPSFGFKPRKKNAPPHAPIPKKKSLSSADGWNGGSASSLDWQG